MKVEIVSDIKLTLKSYYTLIKIDHVQLKIINNFSKFIKCVFEINANLKVVSKGEFYWKSTKGQSEHKRGNERNCDNTSLQHL